MKLQRRIEPGAPIRSGDALMREVPPDSEFFDPRVDFPASELLRLKALAADMGYRITHLHAPEDLQNAWWLTLVDLEFRNVLLSDPEFQDALKAKFFTYYSHKVGTPFIQADDLLFHSQPHIQLFPSLRDTIRSQYGDKSLKQLLEKDRSASRLYEVQRYLVALIQLYPERRAELLTAYSITPDKIIQRLKRDLGDHSVIVNRPQVVAHTLLVFPELRPQILAILHGQDQWIKKFKSANQPFDGQSFELGFYLTVIGAEDARIDETGQIQLHLKPLLVKQGARPLPDRPLA